MASGGTVEWGCIVKPVLSASYGSLTKQEITELVKAIVRTESELLNHDEKYETFYTALSTLAADYISSSLSTNCVSKGQIGIICSASQVLLQYLLYGIKNIKESDPNSLPIKHLLLPIRALCTATSTHSRTDQLALISIMKNAKLPPHIKTSMNFITSQTSEIQSNTGIEEKSTTETTKESSSKARSRADLSNQIMEQLTSPLFDYSSSKKSTPQSETGDNKTPETPSEKTHELEAMFIERNVASLQALGAADVFIDTCLNLAHLSRYTHKYQQAIYRKGFSLPTTVADAQLIRHSLQSVAGDMSIVWSALSLPVLEPLTPGRLEKLTTISMTCLYVALSTATAFSIYGVSSAVSPKAPSQSQQSSAKATDEDGNLEALATTVVEQSLEIFNHILNTIKASTRAGGNVAQNFTLIGAWLLMSGLQGQLTASSQVPSEKPGKEDKGKSPSKSRDGSSRVNLMKVQQGFGVLSVALASHALNLMASLLSDAQYESMMPVTPVEQAELSINANATALQRALTVLKAVPMSQFLFYLATVSYRKACTLKRIQKHPPEGDTFSTSDSTTYYDDDDMSCSDESSPDVDEDSEPLLGLWFEETISVPDCENSSNNQSQDSGESLPKNNETSSFVPEKGEPNGYIALATQIFHIMNKYMVASEAQYVTRYVEDGISEQQMVMLAAIIRDLDRETARTDTGTISVYFGPTLGQLYSEFSLALTRYTHNLLARGILSASLQSTLLLHLGVSPFSNTDNSSWPLQVYTRTLAVLAQVLLLKPQAEKEVSCINIWQRLINTLVENVCNTPATSVDVEHEDLNVEHAQLVLFLFHSLNLMQKKSVLLMCASAVVQVSEKVRGVLRESQILHLSRLLLLLDYLVKNLYDAPPSLLEQVQWNLLSGTSLLKEGESTGASRLFCPCSEVEDNFRKFLPLEEFSMRPRFYMLTFSTVNSQEPPKLDGLACNFILGSPEKGVKYPQLIDALIEILSITDQCTPSIRCAEKISFTALSATHYCFMICWKLLLQLPPSTPFLEKLATAAKIDPTPLMLYAIVWGPRTAHKVYIPWMKDCLVKQGKYTQYAESDLKGVADVVNSVRYDVNLAKSCIMQLMPSVETPASPSSSGLVARRNLPTFMDLCLLNAVIAKAQAYGDFSSKMTAADTDSIKTIQTVSVIQELMPFVLGLTEEILAITRSSMMYQIADSSSEVGGAPYTQGDLLAFRHLLAILSSKNVRTQGLAANIMPLLPSQVASVLEKWSSINTRNFPWNECSSHILPGESYVTAVVRQHIFALSAHQAFTISPSLKHLLHCLVSFIGENLSWLAEGGAVVEKVVNVFAPLSLDACADYLHDIVLKVLEKPLGEPESDKHQVVVYSLALENIYNLIINYTSTTAPCSDIVNEKVLLECLTWMEGLLEKPAGRQALEKFFDASSQHSVVQVLLSVASPRTSSSTTYGAKVFSFFNKMFQFAENEKMNGTSADDGIEKLCASVLRLARVEPAQLSSWLHHVILGPGSTSSAASTTSSEASPPLFTLAGIATTPSSSETKAEKSGSGAATVSEVTPLPLTASKEKSTTLFQENQQLLQHLTAYIIQHSSGTEVVAQTLLEALVPMATQLLLMRQGAGFPTLMYVMSVLAGAGSGKGHVTLCQAATNWIGICKDQITDKDVLVALECGQHSGGNMVDSCWSIVRYVADLLHALVPQQSSTAPARASSPPWEGEVMIPQDPDIDWMEDLTHDDDDDSGGDESDEDSLCNKLCTFTITQREFMNQHWYHCHTCKMIERVGVCSVCAKVCHKGHDVTYAKFGNFFCDCGARESGACQALIKRNPQTANGASATNDASGTGGAGPSTSSGGVAEHMLTSSLRRRPSSPSLERSQQQRDIAKQAALAKIIEAQAKSLVMIVENENILILPLLSLIKSLQPVIEAACRRTSPVGCHLRSQASLKELHLLEKKFIFSDQIMVPTLGSQEGAFENVRMNYSGEQGQTIRQLMSAHMIRRVAMSCLASPHGKRQHLAVAHEKGKITILQLSTLLKQADSSKRKLTLTRLSSAPIPFTVLSVTSNQWNEDFLAVCGLKDCHVLTFTSGGSVAEHLVLHPQLEIGNFIIRAIWLPGSQTQLALVTADFVKIYDLSVDVLSPQYYFLVPTGKIRDATFMSAQDGATAMLLMSSTGYIYTQDMNEESSAKHGAFYVTSTLELMHPELKEANGQVCGGGVSIYYSHALRLLFFSYVQGKSFFGPLEAEKWESTEFVRATLISLPSGKPSQTTKDSSSASTAASAGANASGTSTSAGANSAGVSSGSANSAGSGTPKSSSQQQPLCLWSEVPNHPGIICATLQTSNNPVILMIKPDTVVVQEIKVLPAKAKIMDMVVIRHTSTSSELRTTLLILCEDGSLRIYNASPETTGFWLSPSVQAVSATPSNKTNKKKKTPKPAKSSASISFPVDFFEHCTALNDVEFGGNDLLQIYHTQQIKHRLNTTGLYVVSTKSVGFNVEIVNNDPAHVITGVRVLLGNQDVQRVPAYIEVSGRSIQTNITRNRWFDFPLTREESLQADKKLTLTFGPSQDPDGITMVDSIKVYGKTKEAFGWPEESEEVANVAQAGTSQSSSGNELDGCHSSQNQEPLLERLVSGVLEVLDGCFLIVNLDDRSSIKQTTLSLATNFLTLPTTVDVQKCTKSLISSLHPTKQSYHNYKDQAVLNYVINTLHSLRQIQDANDLDTEAFYRLVLMTRSIAIARPHNLVKFSQTDGESGHLVSQLVDIMWRLHKARPQNIALASVCIPGLTHVEATVFSIVEIVHAFTVAEHNEAMSSLAAKVYLDLLLCPDHAVSFSAKSTIIRVLRPRVKRRRVYIPSPPHSSTPGVADDKPGPISQPSQDSSEAEPSHYEEPVEPIVLLAPDPGAVGGGVSVNMDALLGSINSGGFPPMLDIPPDADDETMVELAIALSLQDEGPSGNLGPFNLEGPAGNMGLVNLGQALQNLSGPTLQALAGGRVAVRQATSQEGGHYSDTTASAGGSDDEGSTAATDGSTLRTSPADQGGSGGSESGGSGVDSITGEHNVSGRSSAYGEQEGMLVGGSVVGSSGMIGGTRSETSSMGVPSAFQTQENDGLDDAEAEVTTALHILRLSILEKLVQHVPQLKNVGGVTSIPFMQVVLMLTSELDGEEERGKACLENLLNAVLVHLSINSPDISDICSRTAHREVQIVIMRLLSVLMSRPKSTTKVGNSSFVSQTAANVLRSSGMIDYCLLLLKQLIPYWKKTGTEEAGPAVSGSLLRPHLPSSPPDMSPFFLRQYVKGHAADVFEAYPQLLTEMALRLPYQVQKHSAVSITFPQAWFSCLCEYMMTQQTPFVRRQVRKLLLFICGNKDKYRQLRDLHSLESHMKSVKEGLAVTTPLSYDALVELTEHLKACLEVATSRTSNWRQFCIRDTTVLPFLVQASTVLDEAVAQTTLQLLQSALCPSSQAKQSSQQDTGSKTQSSGTSRPSKEKVDDSEVEDAQCLALVRQLNTQVPRELLTKFMRAFLLETNASNMRWQAHALVLSIYRNSEIVEQEILLEQLWSLWPQLPSYGRKASQFVDLLGYFSIKSNAANAKKDECILKAVNMLRGQNQVLSQHPNASLYTQLAQYVELDGYYLESDPCLVCNNPELPMTNIKLSSIKIDSKFTTTTQIVKLVSSHTISKITLRIADLKRTKMVRTMNIYYNNRSVQAVVELKNKPAMWHKAKKVTLASGQTEVKVEFPLPIVACNLMVEYADFYENLQASSETLQCPRCSSSVPANPGVCANCGENVFQCHKCRAINYDEKDPFLCHACGFCKYAKFDFTITGRACCAVDPIENDDDRKKTIAAINTHLEKADRVYKQLVGNKPTLEMLLSKISEHRADRGIDEIPNQSGGLGGTSSNNAGSGGSSSAMVNRAIQLLAQRYCTDCKASFDDLSRIVQKVVACRSKLVAYDRSQLEASVMGTSQDPFPSTANYASNHLIPGKCYGCAFAATEHCLILLSALAFNPRTRTVLVSHGLIQELVHNNLRRGTTQTQEEVRQLICLVTGDNADATQELCSMLMERISLTLRGHLASSELAIAVRSEMSLLAALVHKEDSCWEQKLRCVMQLFLMSCSEGKSPVIMESITLPCLKILQAVIKPEPPTSKKHKEKSVEEIARIKFTGNVQVDVQDWLKGNEKHSYASWYKRMPQKTASSSQSNLSKSENRVRYLEEKYGRKWREKTVRPLKLAVKVWLRQVLFNPSSTLARQVTCNMLECLCIEPRTKREILDLLTVFLGELGTAGESAAEYLALYQSLLQQSPWKQYLALKGVLLYLAELLTEEINAIHKFEGSLLTSDLSQGYALKMLTELMASFLDQPNIKQQYKGRLVGAVLNGYLSLRRLVVQRTRLVDETQDKLLELLEEMTTGTEEETKALMTICVQTVEKCSLQDVRTPVFIFERLCSIIYPEENDVGEFYLTLEKDAQQEDFLQGRMLGNPYSCNEPGLGPLMRDVKNKICQDCELIALLEDDNGMELLVNNKIISLDLPVKEVYKKIWVAEGGEGDSMRVVYRMRGLLGDATEEFVETLHAKSQQEVDNEQLYRMANVMADCGGLKVLLSRLSHIRDTVRSRPLLQVTLKLLQLCVKVSRNQEVLCQPHLKATSILLNTFQLCVSSQQSGQLIEQILEIMEAILSKTATGSLEEFAKFSETLGGAEHISSLLECTSTCPSVRSSSGVLEHLAKVLASLTYANADKMSTLMSHFTPSPLDFDKFDNEHTPDDEHKMELFSVLAVGIDRSPLGNTLKDHILSLGIVDRAMSYIKRNAPHTRPPLLHSDSDEWKEFVSKPSLKYILRFLTGLASHHKPTQDTVSVDFITIIHRLEQVSSDEHVGVLAENLLEALRTSERVASMIEEVRGHTKAEKKRLAMAMREKQLGALGMRTNDRGQLTVESAQSMIQQIEELGEETGLVCCICREGYKFQPNKVLGVYTFTKRCNVEEFEAKPRKTVGYSTVTHFNVVHIDCHMSAVRLARARDEWESAALQNANTKCNGLLPLWGPQVPESAFASCLARHNNYLQESTGHRDISYSSTVHDLKLLLLRFAQEKSFHDDTGGGGPQSNMNIIPYLMHMALYVINTTRCSGREVKALNSYLEDSRMELAWEAEGPFYWATLSLLVQSPERWGQTRLRHLTRLLVTAHVRSMSPTPLTTISVSDVTLRPFPIYRSALLFFALIDAIYNNHFKKVVVTSEEQWASSLADYIRHNDEALVKSSDRLMSIYNDELLPCASLDEFFDVLGLLGEVTDPASFIAETLATYV